MEGDYWLFTANTDKTVPAGAKVQVKYITRVSTSGNKYWMAEYFDGDTWVPAPGMEVLTKTLTAEYTNSTETKTQTIEYNMEVNNNTPNNQVDCILEYKNATQGGVQFRMRCVASYTWKDKFLPAPAGNTCRIAGAVGTSPIIQSVE